MEAFEHRKREARQEVEKLGHQMSAFVRFRLLPARAYLTGEYTEDPEGDVALARCNRCLLWLVVGVWEDAEPPKGIPVPRARFTVCKPGLFEYPNTATVRQRPDGPSSPFAPVLWLPRRRATR
jgi:hypothetical protein